MHAVASASDLSFSQQSRVVSLGRKLYQNFLFLPKVQLVVNASIPSSGFISSFSVQKYPNTFRA